MHALGDGLRDDIMYPSAIPFVLVHLGCLAAIWSGVTWSALALCAALYVLRMFAVVAGYHRYFSHRAFSTSRAFQFVLAVVAQSSAQKSVLWWAAKHRHHHLHSDTEEDVHSPRRKGFVYSHLGWIFDRKHDQADLTQGRGPDALARAGVAQEIRAVAGGGAGGPVLPGRGLVRTGRRLPVEHGAGLSRDFLHQLAGACERQQALCHRR